MSWDVALHDRRGQIIEIGHHDDMGGTYVVDGHSEARLIITYNYSKFYYEHLDRELGLKWLDGKIAKDTVNKISECVQILGTTRFDGSFHVVHPVFFSDQHLQNEPEIKEMVQKANLIDLDALENSEFLKLCLSKGIVYNTGGYWKPTPGNAGFALNILLDWANRFPNGVWGVV